MAAVALSAVATLLVTDARRTRQSVDDAQLRQLLHAGAAHAQARLAADVAGAVADGTERTLVLPPALAEVGSVRWAARSAAGAGASRPARPTAVQAVVLVEVHATWGQAAAAQSLRFVRAPHGWDLAAAEPATVPRASRAVPR